MTRALRELRKRLAFLICPVRRPVEMSVLYPLYVGWSPLKR